MVFFANLNVIVDLFLRWFLRKLVAADVLAGVVSQGPLTLHEPRRRVIWVAKLTSTTLPISARHIRRAAAGKCEKNEIRRGNELGKTLENELFKTVVRRLIQFRLIGLDAANSQD